jgi:hypothetical protein
MSSQPLSKARCEQLAELLTNKFKKQFKISFAEKNLLQLVNDEVKVLLTSGQAYEKNLIKLEKKLRAAIEADRKNSNENDNARSVRQSVNEDGLSVNSMAPSNYSMLKSQGT